jgi:flagellum-specific peptidoglycan hydrolase FlgJ
LQKNTRALSGHTQVTKDKTDFIKKIVPWARLINEWTIYKADFALINSPRGIFTSLVLADIILMSEWGTHPVSRSEYQNGYSNNLSLLKSNEYWDGKKRTYNNIEYKAFKDWESYAIEASDYLTFSRQFDDLLREKSLNNQIELYSKFKEYPESYCDNIELLIRFYSLTKYDIKTK